MSALDQLWITSAGSGGERLVLNLLCSSSYSDKRLSALFYLLFPFFYSCFLAPPAPLAAYLFLVLESFLRTGPAGVHCARGEA